MITSVTCTKGNRRVEIFRKGRIFVLRTSRRWLKDKVQMVAPIEEVAAGEMEIDDDGEGAEDARIEPRADEPGDVHHHDHAKCDRVQCDQEQNLYVYII